MFSLDISINILVLFTLILLSGLAGFRLRRLPLGKKNARINELEREMLQAHFEILKIQKEYCELESKFRDLTIPVISLRPPAKEGEPENEERPGSPMLRKNRPTRTG